MWGRGIELVYMDDIAITQMKPWFSDSQACGTFEAGEIPFHRSTIMLEISHLVVVRHKKNKCAINVYFHGAFLPGSAQLLFALCG